MTVNMTINSVDIGLVNVIQNLIETYSPKATFSINELSQEETDKAKEDRISQIRALCGGLSKYANPELIEQEKDAWSIAVKRKYDIR